jgi:hypothetical protein
MRFLLSNDSKFTLAARYVLGLRLGLPLVQKSSRADNKRDKPS